MTFLFTNPQFELLNLTLVDFLFLYGSSESLLALVALMFAFCGDVVIVLSFQLFQVAN